LEGSLTKFEAKQGNVTANISKVVSMDGEVDVSQRKGKVITIYDVKLVLEYSGMHPCGSRYRPQCPLPPVAESRPIQEPRPTRTR